MSVRRGQVTTHKEEVAISVALVKFFVVLCAWWSQVSASHLFCCCSGTHIFSFVLLFPPARIFQGKKKVGGEKCMLPEGKFLKGSSGHFFFFESDPTTRRIPKG